ncbi:MAG: hypothetical protein ABI622_02420 [Chloroflexota bacterium]
MAKRGGKAATRRQRQRATARPAAPRPAPAPAPVPTTSTGADATAVTPIPSTPAASIPTTPRKARPTVGGGLAGSSRLTEKAMAEYHYVRMDLRNIGVLSLVLMGLLAVAYVLVDVLGIGKQI